MGPGQRQVQDPVCPLWPSPVVVPGGDGGDGSSTNQDYNIACQLAKSVIH